MRVAHFGTFDVENYGDLLFPLILESRLSGVCDEFVHVSPAGGPPVWGDCVPTVDFDTFLQETPRIDGVVVGGGQIIRSSPTPLSTYDQGGISPFIAYPSLWLGAAYVAAREGVSLCWNAPGVAGTLPPVASRLTQWTASVTDYLSVRDTTSRGLLEQAGVEQQIHVVPDTALEISQLWTASEIEEAYKNAFATRDRAVPERSAAFHVNRRWAREELSSVAARADRVCWKLEATPIMIAVGPCHGDDEVQRQVAEEMETEPLLVDRPQSLREIAACIARSEAYLGSSLHGMITALSFGTPGVLVASAEDPKYEGFLTHLDLSAQMVGSWEEAETRAAGLLYASQNPRTLASEKTGSALDPHWERLRAVLAREASGRDQAPENKRSALDRLPRAGDENSETLKIFQGLIAEDLADTHAKLRNRVDRLADQAKKHKELKQKLDEQSLLVRELRQRLNGQSQMLREEREKAKRLTGANEQMRRSREEAHKDVDRLVRWIEELEKDISRLRGSWLWRIWKIWGGLWHFVSRGRRNASDGQGITSRLDGTFEQFRAWSRERCKKRGGHQ